MHMKVDTVLSNKWKNIYMSISLSACVLTILLILYYCEENNEEY